MMHLLLNDVSRVYNSKMDPITAGQHKELASISLIPVIPENSLASSDVELQKMSDQVSSVGVCSSVNKSEVVASYSNEEDASSSLSGIHIQSTCSIDLKEFEKIDSRDCWHSDDILAASESREATEIAQSPKNELVAAVERGLDENGENAPASSEADELKFSAKVQPNTSRDECTASSIELSNSNENCTGNDETAVSSTLLENFSEFCEKTSPEKVSPIHDSQTECENSCVSNDGGQVKDGSVDAGDSLTTGDDLQSDEKQAPDSEMDIDSDSPGEDENPVVNSDLGENKNHFCADTSNLAAPDMQSDHSFQGTHDKGDTPLVCRKRHDSGHESRQDASTGTKIPELFSLIPHKVSVRQSRFSNRFCSPRKISPRSGYTEYDDHSSVSGPGFHDNGMRMPFYETHTPGSFPPTATLSPWYGSPVEPQFSCDTSVPPPATMFHSGMTAPPSGCLPWNGSLQPFGSVPPPASPGFVPPGPYMGPTNVFQPPPLIPPPYGVPPAPVGMEQYTQCNGMAPGFPGASQFGISAAMSYPDQSYQEWYDCYQKYSECWFQNYSQWAQSYNSNMGTDMANGSKAVVSTATSKLSGSKSPATVTKPTVVKVQIDKKPQRPVSPIGLIPLPSTAERQVVKVTMSSTKPMLASAVTVETQSSSQREVTAKVQSSSRVPSPPTPVCGVSRKNADISEKTSDSLVTNKTDSMDVSSNSKTAETMWLSSFKQDSTSEPEPTTPSQKQPSPAGESSSWKQRLSLESKPSKPSSTCGRQNLVSLAATFNADSSTAVESKISSSPSNRMFSIGNLPVGIKATEIRTFISRYGTVVNCKVGGLKSQKDAGLFALVTMETEKDVQVCVAKLNETNYNGRRIVVAKFEPH